MADSKDGGSAFPLQEQMQPACEGGNAWLSPGQPGMSLRDYFAGQALPQAILHEREMRTARISPGDFKYDEIARAAYVMADAMIEAREANAHVG